MRFSRLSLLVMPVVVIAACEPIVDQRGHVMEESQLENITPGVSRMQDVYAILGAPSSASDFGEPRWYYIATTKETSGFFKPEITAQQVTQVVFDENGVVKSIETPHEKDLATLKPIEEETPTEGHSLGFWEQMLGNMGRFNSSGAP